jgi:hypothetical protein
MQQLLDWLPTITLSQLDTGTAEEKPDIENHQAVAGYVNCTLC